MFQMELDHLLASGLLSRRDHAERRASFQRDIIEAERSLRTTGEGADTNTALPAVLSAQKAAVVDAARRGLITNSTAARHVAVLDEHILRAATDSPEE